MDEATEAFTKLVFYVFIAPFWAMWHAVRLCWQHIVKPVGAHIEQKRADAYQEQQFAAQSEKQQPRDEVRAKQLAALRAAVPPGVPEKMRATIQLNEFKVARVEQQRTRRYLAEDTWTYVEVGEGTQYAVDMILQMSETERSIISQHNLQHMVIEDDPAFTRDQLSKMQYQDDKEVEAIRDPLLKEITKSSKEFAQDILKDDRKQTFVGDYLVSPFTRSFNTAHEAKLYADKLKTKILPQIKQLIETYREHKQSETVEF